jgi:pimeloyl-ACP methyl ester carboxylesterase
MHDVKETFIRIEKRVPGVLYEPEGRDADVLTTVLVMHSDEDYLTCPTGPELALRGYRVLCANVMSKEGFFFSQVEKMQAVKAAIVFLRKQPNVGRIILMGHSGGATLMTAYQAIAENGADVFRGPEKIYPYPDDDRLPPADGIMILDANWGNAAMQLFSLDPAVIDENSGQKLDKEYNLFELENGFDPNGSTFSQEFIDKFQKKQGERNNAILSYALGRLEKIENGEGLYSDDEPLCIPGADQVFFNNKLYAQDIRLMAHTREPRKLIHADGSITTEIVRSLRGPENDRSMTHQLRDGGRIMTVKNYLSSYAVRTLDNYGYGEDDVWGIDWDSTYSCPPGNIRHIHVPTLVMGMTAGWEYLAAETIYEMSAAADKDLAFVEGANHKFYPDHLRESYPGQFGDTMKTLHDYVADWLRKEGE